MKVIGLPLLFLICSAAWGAQTSVLKETLYQEYRHSILRDTQKNLTGFTKFEHSIYVDALWDLVDENEAAAFTALKNIQTFNFDLLTHLRLGVLRIKAGTHPNLPAALENQLSQLLSSQEVETGIIYTLAAHEKDLQKAGHENLLALARTHKAWNDLNVDAVPENATVLKDLFHHRPEGEGMVLYMFCREDRQYPCLMLMRDRRGEVVTNNDGTVWTHKALASSKKGLPGHERNGDTPAGVHLIDSVMPLADRRIAFGKFRRVMLEFVPRSQEETTLKGLLPASSHKATWWMPSVVARDIGRNSLRIHGTGIINPDPKSPYYPFVRTSGCIAQRENTYEGVTYQDQRELLDTIMLAMDLAPKYENETEIRGVLYLVEINSEKSAVTEKDLQGLGIL